MSSTRATNRRSFLARLAAAAAAAGITSAPSILQAATTPSARALPPDESWLDGLKGRHRQIFDMPDPAAGLPMIHVRNYVDTYKSAYGVSHPDLNAVVGLYGMTVPLALTDAMWAKYDLGAATNVKDLRTSAAARRNVYWKPREGENPLPIAEARVPVPNDTAMTELQKRGVLYIVCNNAMNFWAGVLATASGQTPVAVRAEMDANLIPGIVVVPAMVIAFERAQARGISYMFLP